MPTNGEPEKLIGPVIVFPQTTRLFTGSTEGIGFTFITIVNGLPEQVLDKGVTVIMVDMGPLEELVAVKEGIWPVPVTEANPTAGLLLVQLNIVLVILEPLNIIGLVERLVHNS